MIVVTHEMALRARSRRPRRLHGSRRGRRGGPAGCRALNPQEERTKTFLRRVKHDAETGPRTTPSWPGFWRRLRDWKARLRPGKGFERLSPHLRRAQSVARARRARGRTSGLLPLPPLCAAGALKTAVEREVEHTNQYSDCSAASDGGDPGGAAAFEAPRNRQQDQLCRNRRSPAPSLAHGTRRVPRQRAIRPKRAIRTVTPTPTTARDIRTCPISQHAAYASAMKRL